MRTGKEEWLRRFLDGELSNDEERQALHHIADDPESRALLKFDLMLRQEMASNFRVSRTDDAATDTASASESEPVESGEKISVPDTFFDGVMNAISQKEEPFVQSDNRVPAGTARNERKPLSDGNNGISIWDRLWQPRPVMWRPVWSAGIAAMLILLVVASPLIVTTFEEADVSRDVPARQIVDETSDRVMMRFVYVDDDADSVAVAGDFSDWEPIALTRQSINGDVAWTGIIPLPRGEHRYMFIKDGDEWTTDPFANRFVDDGFGNKNAVVNL